MRVIVIAALVLVGCSPAKPAAQAENQAPPCRDGKASCDPWERDWKDDAPPSGVIVSADGKMTPDKRFDLICKIKFLVVHNGEVDSLSPELEQTLSIDPDAGLWCEKAICRPVPITEISPSFIRLENPQREPWIPATVDRVSGEIRGIDESKGPFGTTSRRVSGTCVKTSFTEFPKTKF